MDAPAGAVTTPGFTDRVAFSGLNNPTSVALRDDTRVFVSQKAGVIKVFDSLDSLDDTTPTVFADPSTQVDDPLSVA